MSSAEFSINYDQVMAAANTFENANGELKQMITTLTQLSEQLTQTWCVGLTGNAAAVYIQQVQTHLQQLSQKAVEMRQDLQNTVQDISGNVDPGMAQRFED